MDNNILHQSAEFLPWESAMSIINRLYQDGLYRMSVLLGSGFYFGLSIEDLQKLTWSQLISGRSFEISECGSNKKREIRIIKEFQNHVRNCYGNLGIIDDREFCFIDEDGQIWSTDDIALELDVIRNKYKLKLDHFDAKTLQQTFGRRILENAGNQQDMAIILLRDVFNQPTMKATCEFLGFAR